MGVQHLAGRERLTHDSLEKCRPSVRGLGQQRLQARPRDAERQTRIAVSAAQIEQRTGGVRRQHCSPFQGFAQMPLD